MAEPLAVRCAAEARELGEDLPGTASRVGRWLLVEQPGAWGADALAESRFEPRAAAALADAARRHRVRVVLIRRPRHLGHHSAPPELRRVYLVHSGRHHGWIEEVDLPVGRDDALLELDLASLAADQRPGIGFPGPASLHLVCTNGRHDPCCADAGRPVVRALAAAGTPDVWESSHIGGDRFAANIVSLPHGAYLGRVEPDEAPAVVADLRHGLIPLDRYRGRCCYPPVVQAAEAFARRHLDERRFDAVSVLDVAVDDPFTTVAVATTGGRRLEVVVRRERADVQQLTCHADEPARPWRHLLHDLRELPGGT